jgi:hypothetical protein
VWDNRPVLARSPRIAEVDVEAMICPAAVHHSAEQEDNVQPDDSPLLITRPSGRVGE